MLTQVQAGPFTLRGISVAGVYTSLQVPELDVVLDVGVPLRSFATTDRIFLSHCHGDHASALASLLGIRALVGRKPPRLFLPAEIAPEVQEALRVLSRLHRCEMEVEAVPLRPGDEHALGRGLWVKAFRTHHPVPSLGYQFFRRVTRLRPEYRGLPSAEVARLRREGQEGLFEETQRLELAYATDTLSRVLDSAPWVLESQVLVLECTYVGGGRTVEDARSRGHLHLEEILERADQFRNEALVLMHFSQGHSPGEVRDTLRARLPAGLRERVVPFIPAEGAWFG